jgi:hypothetical protein
MMLEKLLMMLPDPREHGVPPREAAKIASLFLETFEFMLGVVKVSSLIRILNNKEFLRSMGEGREYGIDDEAFAKFAPVFVKALERVLWELEEGEARTTLWKLKKRYWEICKTLEDGRNEGAN